MKGYYREHKIYYLSPPPRVMAGTEARPSNLELETRNFLEQLLMGGMNTHKLDMVRGTHPTITFQGRSRGTSISCPMEKTISPSPRLPVSPSLLSPFPSSASDFSRSEDFRTFNPDAVIFNA